MDLNSLIADVMTAPATKRLLEALADVANDADAGSSEVKVSMEGKLNGKLMPFSAIFRVGND